MEAQQSKRCKFRFIQGVPVDETSRKLYEMQRARMLRRRAVIKMLGAVVIAFFICWAPFHAQRLLFVYVSISSEWTERLRIANEVVSYLSGVLYFFNATLNPILYNLMSKRFRTAFKSTVLQISSCRGCVCRWIWYLFACIYDIATCACIRDIFMGFAGANSHYEDDNNDGNDAPSNAMEQLQGRQRAKRNKDRSSSGQQHEMKVVDCWQQCSSSARSRGSSMGPPRGSINQHSSSSSAGMSNSKNKRQTKKNKQLKRKLLPSAAPSSQVPAAKNCRTDGSSLPASSGDSVPDAAHADNIGLASYGGITAAENSAPNSSNWPRRANSVYSSSHSAKTVLERAFPSVWNAKRTHQAGKKSSTFGKFLSVGAPSSSSGIFGLSATHARRDECRAAKSEGDEPDLIVDWSLLDPQRRMLATVPRPDLHGGGCGNALTLRHSTSNAALHAANASGQNTSAGSLCNHRKGPVLLETSGGRRVYKFPTRNKPIHGAAQNIIFADSCTGSECTTSNASLGNFSNRSNGNKAALGVIPVWINRTDTDMSQHSRHTASPDAQQLHQKSHTPRGSRSYALAGNLFGG